ncbi:MAG: MurR/RpiR family transcriptional regulator [Pseudomonadota bacterium]
MTRVRDRLHALSPAERRLAEFVLDFPGDLASYSATELARLANVSNATVTRFVRSVGYQSFDEARQKVRAERGGGAALFMVSAASDSDGDAAAAHFKQAQANLSRTVNTLSLSEIDEIAAAMLAAPRVWVIGFRAGRPLAEYFQWQALQVLPAVRIVPGAGETLAEHIADAREDDCALVIGLRRRTKTMRSALAFLAEAKVSIAYLTDGAEAAPPGVSWQLRCQTAAPGPLFNHVAPLALLHLLATRIVERSGTAGRRRLATVEAAHATLDEL